MKHYPQVPKYLIQTTRDFDEIIAYTKEQELFAWDTETNGKFSRFEVCLAGVSLGFPDFGCYIPLTHTSGKQIDPLYAISELRPIFEDPNAAYVAHNAKFDEMVFSVYDINCRGLSHCTYVMAWMLYDSRVSRSLKELVLREFGYRMETYDDVVSRSPKKRGVDRDYDFRKVSLKDALSYASDDAFWDLRLFHLLSKRLKAERLLQAYENIERPFVRVLKDIEATGVLIDRDALDYADKRLPQVMDEIEAEIYETSGEVFNIDSGQQLGRILFEKLGIGKNVPKTATGKYATNKRTLDTYATHPIVASVLRRKKIKKNHSTFVEGLKAFIDKDGRVHPNFNGCGTDTGRLACYKPNLQQIVGDEIEEVKIRDFFVPAEGNCFVVGDYSQVELRVMAHLAKDKNAIAAFLSGKDFHDETARISGIAKGIEISHRERFAAKSLNFGIPYGRGCWSIAEQLGINPKCLYWPQYDKKLLDRGIKKWYQEGEMLAEPCHNCAQCFIEQWFEAFPRVRALKEKTIEDARATGYIRTIAGRKRRLPDIRSSNKMLSSRAERQAFNTVIQGSAADIIKLAMVAMSEPLRGLGGAIAIQVHDELIVETSVDVAEDVRETMKYHMENPLNGKNPLSLPLITEPKIVSKWGDAK